MLDKDSNSDRISEAIWDMKARRQWWWNIKETRLSKDRSLMRSCWSWHKYWLYMFCNNLWCNNRKQLQCHTVNQRIGLVQISPVFCWCSVSVPGSNPNIWFFNALIPNKMKLLLIVHDKQPACICTGYMGFPLADRRRV